MLLNPPIEKRIWSIQTRLHKPQDFVQAQNILQYLAIKTKVTLSKAAIELIATSTHTEPEEAPPP